MNESSQNVLNSIMLDKYAYKITNEICIFFSILLFLCLHVQIIFFSNQILSIKVRKNRGIVLISIHLFRAVGRSENPGVSVVIRWA